MLCIKMLDSYLVYEKRIVAFVDILGFSTLIEDSKSDIVLRRKIKDSVELIHKSAEEQISERVVSTFSDSAVISYPIKDSSLFRLLIDIIHLQLSLGSLGIMIRGGISIGDCYHDGNIIFGPAMNEAYSLESKIALWPRVVIKADTLKKGIALTTDFGEYSKVYDIKEIMSCLKQDDYNEKDESNVVGNDPNLYFIDFLRQPQELTSYGDEYYIWLKNFRTAIIEGLNRYSPKYEDYNISNKEQEISKANAEKIFKKYRWLLNYWNSVVEDEKAFYPVPDIENQLGFRSLYKNLSIRKKYPYI